MAAHSPPHHDFWDEITEPLCATIAEGPVCCDPPWFALAYFKNAQEGTTMLSLPSLEQRTEEEEYAGQFRTACAPEGRPEAIRLTTESADDAVVEVSPEVGVNGLDFNHDSIQPSGDPQPFLHENQGPMRPSFTPTVQSTMTDLTSRTPTAGVFPEALRNAEWDYLSGPSPTPADTTSLEVGGQTSSPTTPTTNTDAKPHRRRLSFGVPLPEREDELRMPPPKLRRLVSTLEDQIYSHYMNEDSTAPSDAEVMFRDIPSTPTTNFLSDAEAPKTPVFYDSGCPPPPTVARDDNDESYPKCCNGIFEEIPLHHLRSLRKAVDPTFQNEQYWGDGLYFLDMPVYNQYYDHSQACRFQILDWSMILHALDNVADRRIPLPDTSTPPQCTDEQVYKIWMRFRGFDRAKAIFQAEMPTEWVEAQTTKALCRWTQVRGSYHQDPPEFNIVQSNDICADLEFSSFCEFARFVEGRPAVMPKGLALANPLDVLRYARLQPVRVIPQNNGLDPQQIMTLSQYQIPGNAALLRNNARLFGTSNMSNSSMSPASTVPQDLFPALSQTFQHTQQIATPQQDTIPLEHLALDNVNIFKSLPRQHLIGLQRQWLCTRAQRYTSLGRLAPTTPPTILHLWHYFRHVVQVKRQQAAREEAQASMVRNPCAAQPETPVSSRPLQLQAHIPATPGPRGQSRSSVVGSANSLASPFETPGRGRNKSVDLGLT